MSERLQSSDAKNETPYNIPLLINKNVISNEISLISLWHTYADEHYRMIWPRDKKKSLIASSWAAVYAVQGCGKTLLKNDERITLHGNCVIFLKPMDIHSYYCEGLVWEQYWMEFILTSMMDTPVSQRSAIYSGEVYSQKFTEVAELITSPGAIKSNLAVAFLMKTICQWICLMHTVDKKDPQRRQIGKLIAILHTSLQQRRSVADIVATTPCSEARSRRLFLRYTDETPKECHPDAHLDLVLLLSKQQGNSVDGIVDTLSLFDSFHFSKASKHKSDYASSAVLKNTDR